MRPETARLLACPACSGGLELEVEEEADGDVVKGSLKCTGCTASYPIAQGIPRLLPPGLFGGRWGSIYERAMAYYDAYVPMYDRAYHNPQIAYMRRVEDAYIELTRPRGRVLDIGCGPGRQSILLARLGCSVLAMDISEGMLLEARRRAISLGLEDRIEFVQASADALPVRPGAFNRAYSLFGAYNHAPAYPRGFRQLWEALRDGGIILISVLNRHQLTWWLETIWRKNKKWLRRRLSSSVEYITIKKRGLKKRKVWTKLFSAGELREALRTAGFVDIRIGALLIFMRLRYKYRPRLELLGPERLAAALEERLRWAPPFNMLGAYLLAIAKKRRRGREPGRSSFTPAGRASASP